jgi:hypothetical protein
MPTYTFACANGHRHELRNIPVAERDLPRKCQAEQDLPALPDGLELAPLAAAFPLLCGAPLTRDASLVAAAFPGAASWRAA